MLTSCVPALATPPTGDHAGEVPVPVPYPPPPARVDVVADPPTELTRPQWVDGQWLWRGRRWVWEPGRWVEANPKTVYAKPRVVRRADGELVWFEGSFRPATTLQPSPPAGDAAP